MWILGQTLRLIHLEDVGDEPEKGSGIYQFGRHSRQMKIGQGGPTMISGMMGY